MNDNPIGYKLLVSYDVRPELINEYRQFVLGQYIPFLGSMGMQISQAWHTAYGVAPNRLLEFVCRERDTVTSLFQDDNWESFNEQLESFVEGLTFKVVPYKDRFQI
jgi:hypothetical protein